MSGSLSDIVSSILERDKDEVKKVMSSMSLRDLYDMIQAIDSDDKEHVLRIYTGYTV